MIDQFKELLDHPGLFFLVVPMLCVIGYIVVLVIKQFIRLLSFNMLEKAPIWAVCTTHGNQEDQQLIKDLRDIVKNREREIEQLKQTISELIELVAKEDD